MSAGGGSSSSSSGGANRHLPTSATAQQQPPPPKKSQRFQFLSKLRNQRQQQQVVPTTMAGRGGECGANEPRAASGENKNINHIGHSNGLPTPSMTMTSRRQQHLPSCADHSKSIDCYSQQAMANRTQRDGRLVASNSHHSNAYTGEHNENYHHHHHHHSQQQQQQEQEQPVALSPASNRRTGLANSTRLQQQQQQVYAETMSHANNGQYEPQMRSNEYYYQQQQQQQQQQQIQSSNSEVSSSISGKSSNGYGKQYLQDNENTIMRGSIDSCELSARYENNGQKLFSTYQTNNDDDYDDDDDVVVNDNHHYAERLRRAQRHQQVGATSEQATGQQYGQLYNNNNNHHHLQYPSDINNHRLHQAAATTTTSVAETRQQQQQLATGDNTTQQKQKQKQKEKEKEKPKQKQKQNLHSPRESQLHVNFNRFNSSGLDGAGASGMGEEDNLEGAESTRKKKYLTAKYGQQQMSLIKKRLKIEMWLHEQLQQLAAKSKRLAVDADAAGEELDEIDIDLDELLDMEDDIIRRHWLVKTLEPFGQLPEDALEKFICDVLEQSKLL